VVPSVLNDNLKNVLFHCKCQCLKPGANVIKLFTMVIYRHSMVIVSFCVIKHYYYIKYHRMAVNYCGKKFYNIGPRIQRDKTSLSLIKYHSILTLELVGLK
jgi:hypothetical protein